MNPYFFDKIAQKQTGAKGEAPKQEAVKKNTMKAAVIAEPGKIEIRQVPIPKIGDDDALIRVRYCGICGTDLHIFHGNYAAEHLPLIPGHEFSGEIVETGKNVSDLKPGTRAVVDMHLPCHRCFYCREGEFLNCPSVRQVGVTRNGAFAEYVCVPARNVLPISDGLPLLEAFMVEPVACVLRSAKKSPAGPGRSAVVLGCGSVGNVHVQMLKLTGAAPVVAMDPSPTRAEIAKETGADFAITDPEKLKETILTLTGGRGADLVVESVGKPELYELAFEIIRPGGRVVGFGLAGPEDRASLRVLNAVMREDSFKATLAAAGQDMRDALNLVEHGRFNLKHHTRNVIGLEGLEAELKRPPSEKNFLKTVVKIS